MKKNYLRPEAELLCFAACEALASVSWDAYKINANSDGTNPSQVDVTLPSNPEGGFDD